MTTCRRSGWAVRLVGMAGAFVLASGFLAALPLQPPTPPYELSAEHLKQAGFHLPSYMPTVWDLMGYQSRLSSHQELTVEWDSIPGLTGRRLRREVEGIALAPNFVLLDRKQQLKEGAGGSQLTIDDGVLVIVAIDSNGEVRGIRIDWDPRLFWGEGYSPDKGWARTDMVSPKETIHIRLPDDPKIRTVVFLKPHPDQGDTWSLREVGRIQLERKKPQATHR